MAILVIHKPARLGGDLIEVRSLIFPWFHSRRNPLPCPIVPRDHVTDGLKWWMSVTHFSTTNGAFRFPATLSANLLRVLSATPVPLIMLLVFSGCIAGWIKSTLSGISACDVERGTHPIQSPPKTHIPHLTRPSRWL